MKIIRWETPLSDTPELYFSGLTDDGPTLRCQFLDGNGAFTNVLIENCGPYMVSNEEYLVHYWNIKKHEDGHTLIVLDSPLLALYSDVIDRQAARHYLFATFDTCLEVISEFPPKFIGHAETFLPPV